MINEFGVIKADRNHGVDLYDDVRTILGEFSVDLGTLCSSSEINKWAKYKPISFNSFDSPTEQEYTNRRWGLLYGEKEDKIYQSLTYDDLKGDPLNFAWKYDRPKGGLSSPYRLSDFNNYYHDAKFPLPFIPYNQRVYIISGYASFAIGLMASTSPLVIQPSEISFNGPAMPLDKAYFGLILKNRTSGRYIIGTHSLPGNTEYIRLNVGDLSPDAWDAWIFASSKQISTADTGTDAILASLDQTMPRTVEFIQWTDVNMYTVLLSGNLNPKNGKGWVVATFLSARDRWYNEGTITILKTEAYNYFENAKVIGTIEAVNINDDFRVSAYLSKSKTYTFDVDMEEILDGGYFYVRYDSDTDAIHTTPVQLYSYYTWNGEYDL